MNCFKVALNFNTLKLNVLSANRLSISKQAQFALNPPTLDKNENTSSSGRIDMTEANQNVQNNKAENISRAMSYYLEKLAERESLIKFKTEEFEIGKRHLAKMMGEQSDTFTQDDINRAIEYLMPSGLFEKKARPFLKHPEDYYPISKMAAFGRDGRPIHHLFYTGNPEYYQIIYELQQKYLNLNKLEDAMNLIRSRIKTNSNESSTKIDLSGSEWISRDDLSKKLNTKIDEFSYLKFVKLLEKLADHSLSKREEPFISQYILPFKPVIQLNEIPSLLKDDTGKYYQQVEVHQRTAHVKLKISEGTGEVRIKAPEGEFNITYFDSITQREQILFPFKVIDKINKFDIELEFNNGGMSCLAKATRLAIAKSLCCFVSTESIEKLRLAGLLTQDRRVKERKKPGQEGARRRYTWKKR